MKRFTTILLSLFMASAIAPIASADVVVSSSGQQTDSIGDAVLYQWIKFPSTFVGYRNYSDSPFSLSEETLMPSTDTFAPVDSRFNTYSKSFRIIDRARYNSMIDHPGDVHYVYTLLPDPPELKERKQDMSLNFIADIGEELHEEELPVAIETIKQTNWLHTFNGAVQFSQAYLSPNWYQGGHNALSLMVNFFWNVKLNEVYHPNLMLDNTVSYKLALNSTPQDTEHKYSVSEDIFQWNFIFGVKAINKWFYSFTSQFKTQMLNTYGENSTVRKASFLSPGTLTLGLGMTYSTTNKPKTLKFNASISPLSYNLNTCIDRLVDPTQYNIPLGAKTKSEIGSNAEVTLDWQITSNISCRSRFFSFTNYKYYLGDWENTFSFTINRFLSTQIYLHLRYDSSTEVADITATKHWRYWMLKEILSFGFSYSFSTK